MSLKICTVPYYNTLPLTWFLKESLPQCELTRDYPANLAAALDSGRVDIAMMPVGSMATLANSRMIGNAVIACHDAVKSVMLYSQKPLNRIRTLALDHDSRTSVALAQILLREFYQNDRYATLPLVRQKSLDDVAGTCDACVVIGDRALTYQAKAWQHTFDLGTLWHQSTGLPFVFAAWVTVAGEEKIAEWRHDGVADALEKARDCGVARLKTIVDATIAQNHAAKNHVPFPIDAETLERYYRQSIVYTLSEAHCRGMQRFFELGHKHCLF
ncbi:MAG: menaquinone biosynthesis protein [Planctomycetaceae bacterium]|nr:menaquinone biosynthesis protein [Planctomycetaceae bacterium]